ncbi:hypothetical protein KKE60_06615 [Patescibacteria group bacterium]|nr:hypothetical protein [Patescibacteria group bacterium]
MDLEFKELDQMVERFKEKVKREIDVSMGDLKIIEQQINKYLKQIKETQEQLERQIYDFEKHGEDLYEKYDARARKLSSRFSSVNESMKDKIKVDFLPYNFEEMINVAERIGRLTDAQFDRFVELAKAFRSE